MMKRPMVMPIMKTPIRKYAKPTFKGELAAAMVIRSAIEEMIPATA